MLAAGNLISACYARNFAMVELLRTPIHVTGLVKDGIITADLPAWFPLPEAVLDVANGAIHTKVKELALPTGKQKINDQSTRHQIDLRKAPLPPGAQPCALTYSPWFRFLSEPVNYNIVNRVADYIADAVRFLFVSNGIVAEVSAAGEGRSVRSAAGLTVEIVGMTSLDRLAITRGQQRTELDLAAKSILIERDMFPAAHEAGRAMLETGDKLVGIEATLTGTQLRLAARPEAAHV